MAVAVQTATATFNGTQDSVAVTWTATVSSSPKISHGVVVSDALGPPVVWIDSSTLTNGGATVRTSARFSGDVNLVIVDA